MEFEKEHRQDERAAKRAQDLDDLHNEMAGRDGGRINRFFGEASAPRSEREKQKAEREAQFTNLQLLLLNDPEYAQLFRETETKLRQAQNRLDVALETIQAERARIEEALLRENLSAEQRQDEEEKLKALIELEEDIRAGQAEIGDMQERMEDKDSPVIKTGLDDFQTRTDEIVNDAERRLNLEMNRSAPASNEKKPTVQASSEIEVPTL